MVFKVFISLQPLSFAPNNDDDCANRFQHIAEITILTVQLIVEFAKRLPGFETITRDDQIALLKVPFFKFLQDVRFVSLFQFF